MCPERRLSGVMRHRLMNNTNARNILRKKPSFLLLFPALIFAVLFSCALAVSYSKPKPPGQPVSGPGGDNYPYAKVIKSVYGTGADQYWIFEPSEPKTESAPLIVFNHGWGAVNPKVYGAWIEHIVRRGNIVIYPRYQSEWRYPPDKITGNAIRAVKNAISRLQKGGHVIPELERFAIVGHSAGGQISANMAALAGSSGLPVPKAVMCVQPGKSWFVIKAMRIPLEDLSKIPPNTLLLCVVGDEDKIARDTDAKKILKGAVNVIPEYKNLVIMVSDDHGSPALKANHFAPCAFDKNYDSKEKENLSPLFKRWQGNDNGFPNLNKGSRSIDALDYYGFWKLFDGLCDVAFYGENWDYAIGNTSQERFMGKWSDGTPVKELKVINNP